MEVRRIFDLLAYQQKCHPNKSALKERESIGWDNLSTADCLELVEKMSVALLTLRVEPADTVLLYTHRSSAFSLLLIQAILQLGAKVAIVGAEEPDHQLKDALAVSKSKIAFVERAGDVDKFRALTTTHKYLQYIYSFYPMAELPNLETLLVVPMAKQLVELQTLKASIHEDDPAFFRYAAAEKSYQTYSHKEILAEVNALISKLPFSSHQLVLSYRCPSNWLELLLLHAYLAVGAQIVFLKNGQSFVSQLAANRPSALGSSKSQVDGLRHELTKLSPEASRLQRRLNIWAIRTGERFTGRDRMHLFAWGRLAIAEWWRYRHWRKKTGNRLDAVFIEEPLTEKTRNLFDAMGIPILVHELPTRFR